jgi:hypothetical protein
LRHDLSKPHWEEELRDLNVNEAWSVFLDKVNTSIKKFVPTSRNSKVPRKKWLDGGTLASVRSKRKFYRRWLQTQTGLDYEAYAKARNKAAKACRTAKRKLEATVAAQAKSNPKSFWSYVQSKNQDANRNS